MVEAMGGQTLFARPHQSVGQPGLVPLPRSPTLEGETQLILDLTTQ